jgi:hypothetical protein
MYAGWLGLPDITLPVSAALDESTACGGHVTGTTSAGPAGPPAGSTCRRSRTARAGSGPALSRWSDAAAPGRSGASAAARAPARPAGCGGSRRCPRPPAGCPGIRRGCHDRPRRAAIDAGSTAGLPRKPSRREQAPAGRLPPDDPGAPRLCRPGSQGVSCPRPGQQPGSPLRASLPRRPTPRPWENPVIAGQ